MKKHIRIAISAIALSCAVSGVHASPGAHGPNGEHLDGQSAGPAAGLARLPDGSVHVPKLAQRRMSIRTIMVQEADQPQTVELNGRTSIDPNAGGRVQAPFAGRVDAGPGGIPSAGTRVRKGQVLVFVKPVAEALERGTQQARLAELRAGRALLERRVKRLAALEGAVPAKEIEAARAELAANVGSARALSDAVQGREAITASSSGVIASANVLAGQIVETRDVLFDIVDPDRMLVEAQVSDPRMAQSIASAHLAGAQEVELSLLGLGRSLRDGALPVTFRARGRSLPLALGQPVTVVAKLKGTVRGIALPAAALTRNQANQAIVWIKSGALRFIALPVEAKSLDADTVVVTKGLTADNRVVVAGASLINQIR